MPLRPLRNLFAIGVALLVTVATTAAQDDDAGLARRLERWHSAWRDGRLTLDRGAGVEAGLARQLYGDDVCRDAPQVLSSHQAGLVELLARVSGVPR